MRARRERRPLGGCEEPRLGFASPDSLPPYCPALSRPFSGYSGKESRRISRPETARHPKGLDQDPSQREFRTGHPESLVVRVRA